MIEATRKQTMHHPLHHTQQSEHTSHTQDNVIQMVPDSESSASLLSTSLLAALLVKLPVRPTGREAERCCPSSFSASNTCHKSTHPLNKFRGQSEKIQMLNT
jgi:hypothetical protein